MKNRFIQLFSKNSLQLLIFLSINSLFILKYAPRYGINSYILLAFYIVAVYSFYFFFNKLVSLRNEKLFKTFYWILLLIAIVGIVLLLIMIDPYSIRVDRWSALTFFWDSVFNGIYPYATHTHVSVTNFASPFPVWHLISLPFYLLKDVGIGIIFFLVLLAFSIKYYFITYRKSFFFLFLLFISPAYWWEVSARSDSLSNGILVFMIILWFIKGNYNLSNRFVLSIFICGAIASTRFTALLPLSLFFFQSYLKLPLKKKIIFPLSVFGIALLSFLPFIFWDTDTWIFFSRNPFMSQTANGNIYVLLIMLILGIVLAFKWKNTLQYFYVTAIFISIFILVAQITRLANYENANFFSDAVVDISYFTLALPYCLAYLTSTFNAEK
jgi:hypothetical protein